MEGFVYGMYTNPPVSVNKCVMCDWAANGVSDASSILLDLEFLRSMWVDLGFFNSIGGWDLIPPLVQSSKPHMLHPLVSKQYKFVTWRDTVEWSKNVGADTHFALTEFGMQINQGFNDFTDDIIDGFSEFGDGFHFHINSARSSLRK